jgi:ATP-binding cassette subfamily C (CFTR/MRP) protein 1
MRSATSSAELSNRLATLIQRHSLHRTGNQHVLWWSLLHLVLPDLYIAAALNLLEIFATLVTPVAIYQLLTWTEHPTDGQRGGAVFVVVLGFAAVCAFLAQYFAEHYSKRAGVKARAAVSGQLFNKLLQTPTVDAQASNSGEIISFFEADAQALVGYWHGLLGLVLQPFEIIGNIGLLFFYVGEAAAGGLSVVVVALIISHCCGNVVEKLAFAQAAITDLRLRDAFEMLSGMKVVKMNGWEPKFSRVIRDRRRLESQLTARIGRFLAIINVTSSNSVDVISLAVVLVYTLAMGKDLSPAIVFTYWVLLGLLHARIFHYPQSLKHVKDGTTALSRIQSFLLAHYSPDARLLGITSDATTSKSCVDVAGASMSWQISNCAPTKASDAILTDVTLQVPLGKLVAVVGPVGCGKSTLLQSILGECYVPTGTCSLRYLSGCTPYVPQIAWILPGSARDNILLGRKFDGERYDQVVLSCCLLDDFKVWPQGDATNIGAMTISGGQRQRIALARAAYGVSDLYLLDDCLSALDQRVSRRVLTGCISSLLAGSTRLVVTSAASVVEAADLVCLIVPTEGDDALTPSRTHRCVVDTLTALQNNPATQEFVQKYITAGPASVDDIVPDVVAVMFEPAPVSPGASCSPDYLAMDTTRRASAVHSRRSSINVVVPRLGPTHDYSENARQTLDAASALRTDQAISSSRSASKLPFLQSWIAGVGGPWYALGVTMFLAGEAACVEVGVYWLALWSEDPAGVTFSFNVYLIIYSAFVLGELLSAYIRQHLYVCGTNGAADRLHDALLATLLEAPMSTFDKTSASALVQWFSRDLHNIDSGTFYASEYFWLGLTYGSLVFLVQLAVSLWVFVPLGIVAFVMYFTWRSSHRAAPTRQGTGCGFWRASVRVVCGWMPQLPLGELMEREHATKIPLMEHITTCLSGLPCIRAFSAQQYFTSALLALMDTYSQSLMDLQDSEAFQILRGNLMGALYYIGSVAIIVPLRMQPGGITPGMAGFIVVNSCFASSMVNLVVEHAASLSSLAYTRGQLFAHICNTRSEESPSLIRASFSRSVGTPGCISFRSRHTVAATVPAEATQLDAPVVITAPQAHSWPSKGSVQFRNVCMRYSAASPLVLKGINLLIPAGCHVGICGRTGAGKSSMIAALTRLVNLESGSIVIDGVDINMLTLHRLRSGLTVISQEPLFVSGTLRRNLDPFNEFGDEKLIGVLQQVRLADVVTFQARKAGLTNVLELPIAEKGANLSLGEQQLLAAARSWLREPKVLLMDEATAALDAKSEDVLQETVRHCFSSSTVIQIAHRLQSIVQCHLVVVMDAGLVAECDHPYTLAQRTDSIFASMLNALPESQRHQLLVAAQSALARDVVQVEQFRLIQTSSVLPPTST